MNVVIVGARLRSEQEDTKIVNELVDGLKEMYADNLFIITTACDRGVGKIIKNRLTMPPFTLAEPEIEFLEIQYKIYAKDRPKAFYAKTYITRNFALRAAGEEFHIFLDDEKRGHMQHLLDLIQEENLPYSLYNPGEVCGPKLRK